MEQQGEAGCGNPKGKFDPASAVERDLKATARLISFSIMVVFNAKPATEAGESDITELKCAP